MRAAQRALVAVCLSGLVLVSSAGGAAADHDGPDAGICPDSPFAEPTDPDEGVSSGADGVSSFDSTGGSEPGPDGWCYDFESGGGAADGGGVPESTGTLDDEDFVGQAGPQPVPNPVDERCDGGAEGGEVGDVGGLLPPESDTADIMLGTGSTGLDEGRSSVGAVSSFGAGRGAIRALLTCPAPVGDVGDANDDIVAPNRIDAGVGGAATSAAGQGAGAIMGGSALLAAVLEGLRRRRRR